eukprot:6463625-Amphidinium_carterae.2
MKDKDPTILVDADDEEDALAPHASLVEEPVDKNSEESVDRNSEEPTTLNSEESDKSSPEEPSDTDAAALHVICSWSVLARPAHSVDCATGGPTVEACPQGNAAQHMAMCVNTRRVCGLGKIGIHLIGVDQ